MTFYELLFPFAVSTWTSPPPSSVCIVHTINLMGEGDRPQMRNLIIRESTVFFLFISITLNSLIIVLFWKGPESALKEQIKISVGTFLCSFKGWFRKRDYRSHACDLRWQYEDKSRCFWQDKISLDLRKSLILSNNERGQSFHGKGY